MGSTKTTPIGGIDYPRTWLQFLDWFHSEQACRDYLEKLRWADSLICPKCGVTAPVERMSRGRLICPACRHQATVTAGTIFDKTRTELRVWFATIWYITNQKHGVSALGLQRVLGLGSLRQHGPCCIVYAEQWSALIGSCSMGRSKSMRPTLHSLIGKTPSVPLGARATPPR